jgi:hypothetical protein
MDKNVKKDSGGVWQGLKDVANNAIDGVLNPSDKNVYEDIRRNRKILEEQKSQSGSKIQDKLFGR